MKNNIIIIIIFISGCSKFKQKRVLPDFLKTESNCLGYIVNDETIFAVKNKPKVSFGFFGDNTTEGAEFDKNFNNSRYELYATEAGIAYDNTNENSKPAFFISLKISLDKTDYHINLTDTSIIHYAYIVYNYNRYDIITDGAINIKKDGKIITGDFKLNIKNEKETINIANGVFRNIMY
jgi:hypothetical protein